MKTKIEIKENEDWPHIAYNIDSLSSLVDLEKGPVDWVLINRSWVVSHNLMGKTCVLTVKDHEMVRAYNDRIVTQTVPYDYEIQMEILEAEGVNYCVDVMYYNGESVTHKTLYQRLAVITPQIARDHELVCHRYYAYNDKIIKLINKYNVVDFVVQNALSPYNESKRRLVEVTINNHAIKNEEYNEPICVDGECVVITITDEQEYKRIKEIRDLGTYIDDLEHSFENVIAKDSYVIRRKVITVKIASTEESHYQTNKWGKHHIDRIDNVYKLMNHASRFPILTEKYDVADRVLEKT